MYCTRGGLKGRERGSDRSGFGKIRAFFWSGEKSPAKAKNSRAQGLHEILLSHWLSGVEVDENQSASLTLKPCRCVLKQREQP